MTIKLLECALFHAAVMAYQEEQRGKIPDDPGGRVEWADRESAREGWAGLSSSDTALRSDNELPRLLQDE
jgi:hypothetical protein